MKESICLALGFFDSVHFGHRLIIEQLKKKANTLGSKAVVSTFSDSFCTEPKEEVREKNYNLQKLVYTFSERQKILLELGISDILVFDFNDEFKAQTAQEFFFTLTEKYKIEYVICGYDYRFGRGGSGDIKTLAELCRNNNIELKVMDKVCLEGNRVSTSQIKELLSLGDLPAANRLLSGDFFMYGSVQKGRGEGRKNSFPTANLSLKKEKLLPKSGVYATKTEVFGLLYDSVTSVGLKPTYDDYSLSVETFIDGFNATIYDKEIKIIFKKYLRDIKKFHSKAELKEQIQNDIALAKEFN